MLYKPGISIQLAIVCMMICSRMHAQERLPYTSLDAADPIIVFADRIVYAGDTIQLGPHSFFVDGRLTNEVAAASPFIFNDFKAAAASLQPGTPDDPMTLHLAPWVYWIDDPNDTATRVSMNGSGPYGMVITCPWLRFHGLNKDARNVVLACNRGQTIGARGNFTMFRLEGDGISSENITFGNFCNVDLVFPLAPSLNRKRRADAIVQAQLILTNGDKVFARNTRFVSRLNLCPFVGAKRILFDGCHFECTDDALTGTGVYMHSTFDIYSSKPFYHTTGTGAVFLDCDIRSIGNGPQYFTKANGQLAVVDTRFTGNPSTIGWRDVIPPQTRNYQSNVQWNNKQIRISAEDTHATVVMDELPVLNAYRFNDNGRVYYNTYNLLRGDDEWDPLQLKPVLQKIAGNGKQLTTLPVQLLLSSASAKMETGKDSLVIKATCFRFGQYAADVPVLQWKLLNGGDAVAKLVPSGDSKSCTVIPLNNRDTAVDVVVESTSAYGLRAAAAITILPAILPAPAFSKKPSVSISKNGVVQLLYALADDYKDDSDIRWYRSRDSMGKDAVEIAVSRSGNPMRSYELHAADVGYYVVGVIRPRHTRSELGKPVIVTTNEVIKPEQVKTNAMVIASDFTHMSSANQPLLIPGFWMLGHTPMIDPEGKHKADTTSDAWYYGDGMDGAQGLKGFLQGRSAVMRYEPLPQQKGDMQMVIKAAPFKSAGQGFAVAHLYMDILIKFDHQQQSGYALRLMRTTWHSDAVEACLIEYQQGKILPLSDTIATTAFRTLCTIELTWKHGLLQADLSTDAPPHRRDHEAGVMPKGSLSATTEKLTSSGLGVIFNGGSPVLFKQMQVEWKP